MISECLVTHQGHFKITFRSCLTDLLLSEVQKTLTVFTLSNMTQSLIFKTMDQRPVFLWWKKTPDDPGDGWKSVADFHKMSNSHTSTQYVSNQWNHKFPLELAIEYFNGRSSPCGEVAAHREFTALVSTGRKQGVRRPSALWPPGFPPYHVWTP